MSDNSISTRPLRICGICSLSLIAACILARLFGTLFFFDVEIGYYQSGIVPFIAKYLPVLCVLLAGAYCVIPTFAVNIKPQKHSLMSRIAAALCSLGFLTYSIKYLFDLIEYSAFYGEIPTAYIVTLASAVLSAVFFALTALDKATDGAAYVLTGICVIIFAILSVAEAYFDVFVQMNSPIKTVYVFALLSLMLLVVNEIRCRFDDKRSAFHLFSAIVASLFLGMSSIPSIIAFLADRMPHSYILFYIDCLLALLFVFALTRLISLCFAPAATAVGYYVDDGYEEPHLTNEYISDSTQDDEISDQTK